MSCPSSQSKARPFIPIAMENPDCQILKKQPEQGRSLPFLVQKPQEVISQLTPNLAPDNRACHMHALVSLVPDDLVTPDHWEKTEQHLQERFMSL